MAFLPAFLAAFLLAASPAGADARAPVSPAPTASAAPPRASAKAYSAYLRGRMAELAGDWRAALAAYRAAVDADPRAATLWVVLAEAQGRTGDLKGSEASARKAIELAPSGTDAADAWLILGRGALVSRRPADAEKAFRAAMAIEVALSGEKGAGEDDIDPEAWRLLAQVRLEAGDSAEAETVLDDLARRRPSDGGLALRDLGKTLADRGEVDRAAAILRKAVAAERRDVEAWRRLATLEESRRHLDEARVAWEGLLRQDSDDTDALVALGRLSLRQGKVDAARAFLEQAVHVSQDDVEARTRVAAVWLDARRPAEARAVVDGGLRTSEDARLLYFRGLALREERRWDEAAAAFGGAASGDPAMQVPAMAARASVLAQAGKVDAALSLLDSMLARNPGDARLVAARAYVLGKGGRGAEAVRYLEGQLRDQPRNERLLFALGVAQDRAGDRVGAVETMRRVIELSPSDAEALNFVGYGLAEEGKRLDEAQSLVTRALELEPDNGSFLDSLGWIQFRRGEFTTAVATLERADALAGPEPTILEHLGEAYHRVGRDADAAKAWRRALQALDDGAEPDVPDQRAMLERKLRDLPGADVRPARR